MISAIQNCNGYNPSFNGICLTKGINTGINVAKSATKSLSNIKRSTLPNVKITKILKGPEEIKKANKIVLAHTGASAGIAATLAQAPGGDEMALAANELLMATEICNGVYKMSFSSSLIKGLLTSIIGNKAGMMGFKMATKFLSWIPGAGNVLNAGVASVTTGTLGKCVIEYCERYQKNNMVKNIGKIVGALSK